MLLKKLIKNISPEKKKIEIQGISSNSKKIKRDYIFFAIKGNQFNGEKYIKEAVENGAVVIVCSQNCKYINKKITVLRTKNVRNFLSEISSKFYPLKPKNIIAVTGTNGKTSVADLFYQILILNNVPVASIGTLGIKYNKKFIKSSLTSPDTISLHRELENIKKHKINNVIIEASSHGLHQNRMNHLKLKAGIFTNFTQDHLDYHKSMNVYFNSKMLLFKKILPKKKTIICDKTIEKFPILKKISKKRHLKMIEIDKIKKKLEQLSFLNLNIFQIKNLSMAVAAAKLCNLKEKKIFNSLKDLKDVSGRLELIRTIPNNIKIYIDYAHSPDALLNVLKALIKKHGKHISLVFGCGGDRDFKKRPLMAKIASKYCKKIYVTDDNPRNENPKKIRNEIFKNIKNCFCLNIGNRSKAIKKAVYDAEPNDIILVAGKGHETNQIYKNKKISISDKQVIKNLKLRKNVTKKYQNFYQNKKILNDIKKVNKIQNFHGIQIDSRLVEKNNLFLTIKGKNNDGKNFISHAIKKGAKHIISSKIIKKFKNKTLKVKNEVKFLNEFASKKREYTSAKVLAITGSAGKTSLKNLIKDLLQNFGDTLCSPKSFNNHFGVPLSLSLLNTNHKYGVFEIGMSRKGEINKLSKLVKPHIGIITNIGEAHIENFKNLKGIADAKAEIINNIQKDGTIILNKDDKFFEYLKKKAKMKKLKVISCGMDKKADVHLVKILKKGENSIIKIKLKNQILNLKIKELNIHNILFSLALLEELNLDLQTVIKNFNSFEPTEGRGKIHKIQRYKKNFRLIDESYNANPLSVKNAIKNFNSIRKENFKKYLLLGDMLELGRKSEALHINISKVINNSDIDKVFIKGRETLATYRNINKNKRGNIFQQDEDVDFTLNNIIANNDYLMIKGSNATGLNNITKRIIKG